MLSDRDIMLRVQAGETSLYAELVLRYRPRLLKFAVSKVHDLGLAEDLVQETLLSAFHARNTYSPKFAFSTWIWTISLNLARRQLRQNMSERVHQLEYSQQAVPIPDSSVQPIDHLLHAELHEQLHQLLDRLPASQSDAIRLRFLGELSFEEIAATMECSVSGAKRRVKTGILKLTEMAQSFGSS